MSRLLEELDSVERGGSERSAETNCPSGRALVLINATYEHGGVLKTDTPVPPD